MDAYNHYMLSGKPGDMINRLKWHWGISAEDKYLDTCTKCGACESACTQHLPIIERLHKIKEELAAQLAGK